MAAVAVRHYMGQQACPQCGSFEYDPEPDSCRKCEPGVEVYRVAGFTRDWLRHSEEPPPKAPVRIASRRHLPIVVAALIEEAGPFEQIHIHRV